MSRVVFAPSASDDLEGIANWISADNPAAADRLLLKIEEHCNLYAKFPHTGERVAMTRRRHVRRFSVGNYVIFFRPIYDGIEVLHVWHSARGEQPRF